MFVLFCVINLQTFILAAVFNYLITFNYFSGTIYLRIAGLLSGHKFFSNSTKVKCVFVSLLFLLYDVYTRYYPNKIDVPLIQIIRFLLLSIFVFVTLTNITL